MDSVWRRLTPGNSTGGLFNRRFSGSSSEKGTPCPNSVFPVSLKGC